jgi:ribosome-binding protein aMBF1 (putative translation factor)
MSKPMKVQITGEFADISVRVPAEYVDGIKGVIEHLLSMIDKTSEEDDGRKYTVDEVFPEGIRPMDVLKGARYREGLTQAQLASKVGIKATHISEMERGKRPIGKEMAKRLAKALNARYKVFL